MISAGRQIVSKDSVPKANELAKLKNREKKNFLKENLNKAVFEMKPPSRPSKADEDAKQLNKHYGKIPNYLNKYKEQKED